MTDMLDNWDGISTWWVREVAVDPVYQDDVGPMLDVLVSGTAGPVLELGCGEGQWLRRIEPDTSAFGTDAAHLLLRHALKTAPVVRGVLPELGWVRSGAVGTAISLFVLRPGSRHFLRRGCASRGGRRVTGRHHQSSRLHRAGFGSVRGSRF